MKYNNKKNMLTLKFFNNIKTYKKKFFSKDDFPLIKKLLNDGVKVLFNIKENINENKGIGNNRAKGKGNKKKNKRNN